MNFESLVGRINLIQDALQAQAAQAVNLSLTARNWLVGYYIVEFEQHGEDRAKYGEMKNGGCRPPNWKNGRHHQKDSFIGSTILAYYISQKRNFRR